MRLAAPVLGFDEGWAHIATPMAGDERGAWLVPDVGDEVVVAFDRGDAGQPLVIGSLWNDASAPPVEPGNAHERTVIRTRSRSVIEFDDSSDPTITIATDSGQRIELATDHSEITITDGAGGVVRLRDSRVEIEAATITVQASTLDVDAGMAKFSGVVQADTVITNNVVASSYSPGAGNVM